MFNYDRFLGFTKAYFAFIWTISLDQSAKNVPTKKEKKKLPGPNYFGAGKNKF